MSGATASAATAQGQPVLITGMHRSGTSAVAGLLRLLGVWLGSDEDLIPPAPDNPLGFFEHRELMALNVELLRTLGRKSDEPRLPFPKAWYEQEELSSLYERARAVISRDLGGRPVWGWKDPRTCLTLPFWLRVVPSAKIVFIFRDPLEVAASLHNRGNYTPAWGLHLWAAYHWAFTTWLRSPHRARIVSYQTLLSSPREVALSLATFLGCERENDHLLRAASFVQASLHRNRRSKLTWPEAVPRFPFRAAETALRTAAASGGCHLLHLLPHVLKRWALGPPTGVQRFVS